MLYRICTENTNYDEILKIIYGYFDGFTVLTGTGYWKGGKEHCLIIEITTDNVNAIEKVAYAIKKANKQESVLIETIPCECKFL